MTTNNLSHAFGANVTRSTLAVAALLCAALVGGTARAQSSTTGAIQGRVTDKTTGDALAGVAVVAASPAVQGTPSALTSADGSYKISNLPPGTYTVSFFYNNAETKQQNVQISLNRVTPVFMKLDTSLGKGEVINVTHAPPQIDTTDTKIDTHITSDYLENMPVPGRTFESALGTTPGSANDGMGVSFSGSSSLENQYIVDGINTTGLTYGTVGSSLLNDFIEEIDVITGAYNAEYGRATGGVVNVVTKSGSNEFKGQVFTYITPGFAVADVKRTNSQDDFMNAEVNTRYVMDFGFDLGGPIIKDKVWFYVAFAPQFSSSTVTTVTNRLTDCRTIQMDGTLSECVKATGTDLGNADQNPDVDPDTDQLIWEEIDRTDENDKVQLYTLLTKLNFAATPEHQGQVQLTATPGTRRAIGVFGEPQAVNGDVQQLTTDLSAKWTSKFNNNKTEVEGVVGWHREAYQFGSISDEANDIPGQRLLFGKMGNWSGFGAETDLTAQACRDSNSGGDDYPLIDNCPDLRGRGYLIGGPGGNADNIAQRVSGRVSATQRVEAAGQHEVKAGLDLEDNRINTLREFTGGRFIDNFLGNQLIDDQNHVDVFRWVRLAPPGDDSGEFSDDCGLDPLSNMPKRCDYLNSDRVHGRTINWSAYLQDSWQILPNLTFNFGMRYEEQRMRYRDDLIGTRDPITGNIRGKNAMVLKNMWAPRVGLIYDWTKEGRSKISVHWGRFYDNIPLDINERSFGGEAELRQSYTRNNTTLCGASNPNIGGADGANCMGTPDIDRGTVIGGAGILVEPGIQAQYMDELAIGAEYEVMEDLKVGIQYQNRRIGRVLEDVSVDNANTYIFANPGEFSKEEERKLQHQIDNLADEPCMPSVDADSEGCKRSRLESDLAQYKGIRIFDKPRRDYNSIQLLANKRFSKGFFAQASYTYSILEGNYPGKFSADTGQVDPNLTSQFDLLELLANRDGRLPNDRPHYFKIDGFYQWKISPEAGTIIPGVSFRAQSGTPIDALGAHYLYGLGESYLLPRGSLGRTAWDYSLDLRVAYARKLTGDMRISVFADFFNIFNRQAQGLVFEDYTYDEANPVVGGTYKDLIFLKRLDNDGNETSIPVNRNEVFKSTAARYAPFVARFGARLTF